MEILYHFRTRGTGAEAVHIAGIANALEKAGHSVTFVSPTNADPRSGAGATPYRPSSRRFLARLIPRALSDLAFELLEIGYNAAAFLKISRLLRARSIGLVYERHAFFLCAAALLLRRKKIPLVVEVNELLGDERVRPQPWLAPLARLADRLTFSAAQLIVVVSPHLKRRIASMGISDRKILVLPNAVAERECTLRSGTTVRSSFGITEACVIGFVGWFVPWHRLELLIQALAALSETHPEVRLLLVGDGPLKPQLRELATQLGFHDRLIFAGSVPHAEIPEYIASLDIAVIPHSNEYRSPIKLFEYLAQARATVAPRTEPIAQVMADGENGLLFEPGSLDQLQAALSKLIQNPELRTRLGANGRGTVLEHHTWSHNARAVLEALHPATPYAA